MKNWNLSIFQKYGRLCNEISVGVYIKPFLYPIPSLLLAIICRGLICKLFTVWYTAPFWQLLHIWGIVQKNFHKKFFLFFAKRFRFNFYKFLSCSNISSFLCIFGYSSVYLCQTIFHIRHSFYHLNFCFIKCTLKKHFLFF